MKKFGVLSCVLAGAVGAAMLFAPESFVKIAVVLVGIRSITTGFYGIFYVRGLLSAPQFKKMVVARGILCAAFGALLTIFPLYAAKIAWTAFLYLVAIYLAAISALQICVCVKMKENAISIKNFVAEIVFSLVIAAAFFAVPLQTGIALVRIFGAASAVGAIVFAIFLTAKERK